MSRIDLTRCGKSRVDEPFGRDAYTPKGLWSLAPNLEALEADLSMQAQPACNDALRCGGVIADRVIDVVPSPSLSMCSDDSRGATCATSS